MIAFVGADLGGPFGHNLPSGDVAAGCHEPAGGEGVGDASPHLGFVVGLCGEEHPEPDFVTVALGNGGVRGERAGRQRDPNSRTAPR